MRPRVLAALAVSAAALGFHPPTGAVSHPHASRSSRTLRPQAATAPTWRFTADTSTCPAQGQCRMPRAGRPRLRPRQSATSAAPRDVRRPALGACPRENVDGEDDRPPHPDARLLGRAGGDERARVRRGRVPWLRPLRRHESAATPQARSSRTEPRGSHEIWLQQAGRRAYVYVAMILSEVPSSPDAATPGLPDFRIFDVSNPRRPAQVGGWEAPRSSGSIPSRAGGTFGGVAGNLVHSVITNRAGTRAFLSYWDLGHGHPRHLASVPATLPRPDDLSEGSIRGRPLGLARRARAAAGGDARDDAAAARPSSTRPIRGGRCASVSLRSHAPC